MGSNWQTYCKGFTLSRQQLWKICLKLLFHATLALCMPVLFNDHVSTPYNKAGKQYAFTKCSVDISWAYFPSTDHIVKLAVEFPNITRQICYASIALNISTKVFYLFNPKKGASFKCNMLACGFLPPNVITWLYDRWAYSVRSQRLQGRRRKGFRLSVFPPASS